MQNCYPRSCPIKKSLQVAKNAKTHKKSLIQKTSKVVTEKTRDALYDKRLNYSVLINAGLDLV